MQVGRGLAPDGDVVDVGQAQSAVVQDEADRFAGKAGPVLDAPDALLLDGRDELSVDDQRGGRVPVVGVDPQDVQRGLLGAEGVNVGQKSLKTKSRNSCWPSRS